MRRFPAFMSLLRVALRLLPRAAAFALSFALVALRAGPLTFNPPSDTPGPFTFWASSVSVRTDLGYRDNVLQSATNQHSSFFSGLGADLFVFRMPVDGTSFSLFFSADDRRYFDAVEATTNGPGATKEQSFITHATLKKTLPKGWSFSLVGMHVYADQVYDASEIENGAGSVLAQVHQFTLTPSIRRDFGAGFWTEAAFAVSRQEFREPVSSFWEGGPKLTLGWGYRTNSSVELAFSAYRRPYDDSFQVSAFGDPYPALSLTKEDFKTELIWKHTWDRARHWSTSLRLYHLRRLDNGEGWYDLDRLGASLTAKYERAKWVVRGTTRWVTYDYPVQLVSPLDPSLRTRDELELEGRIEYHLNKHLTLYGSYLHERARSNVALDAFRSNTGLAGLEYEF